MAGQPATAHSSRNSSGQVNVAWTNVKRREKKSEREVDLLRFAVISSLNGQALFQICCICLPIFSGISPITTCDLNNSMKISFSIKVLVIPMHHFLNANAWFIWTIDFGWTINFNWKILASKIDWVILSICISVYCSFECLYPSHRIPTHCTVANIVCTKIRDGCLALHTAQCSALLSSHGATRRKER